MTKISNETGKLVKGESLKIEARRIPKIKLMLVIFLYGICHIYVPESLRGESQVHFKNRQIMSEKHA
jgi:hypothetical protein